MCKTKAIVNEILCKHHPMFKNPVILEAVNEDANIFNVEHLVEKTMALVGGDDFVDGDHHDFSDGTECKTASVYANPIKQRGKITNSYKFEISNVVSPGGSMKTGDIRLVLYNPIVKEGPKCTFYYIPNEDLVGLGINYHPTTGMGRIVGTYNSAKNSYSKIADYEICCFKGLATKKRKG